MGISKNQRVLRCVALAIVVVVWPTVRTEAAAQTSAEESSPVAAWERLQRALESEEPQERLTAVAAVSVRNLAPQDRAAMISLLIKALDDKVPDVRARAAETLGQFGDSAREAIPRLIKQLGDEALTQSLEQVWVSVSRGLGGIGMAALQPLIDAIPASDRTTYYGITGAIAEMGVAAKSAAPILIQQMREGPENRRWATMYALAQLGDAAAPAIPDFVEQLDHVDFNMQVMACRALAAQGPAAKPAVPQLLYILDHGILSPRTHAAMCLAAIGPVDGVDTVGILSAMAQEGNAFSQERAMIGLGTLGRHALEARHLIENLIETEEFSPKPEAAYALWLITGEKEKTLEVLMKYIDSPTYDFRVLPVLEAMGPEAAGVADELAKRLGDDDQGIRLLAVKALGAIGPAAAPHLDALKIRRTDSEDDVVAAIDEAITKIAPSGD